MDAPCGSSRTVKRGVLLLVSLSVALTECKWIGRRRHRDGHRARSETEQVDPRRLIATACADSRYVYGERIAVAQGNLGQVHSPRVITAVGHVVVAWTTGEALRVAIENRVDQTVIAAPGVTGGFAIATVQSAVFLAWRDNGGGHVAEVTLDGVVSHRAELGVIASEPSVTVADRKVFIAASVSEHLSMWRFEPRTHGVERLRTTVEERVLEPSVTTVRQGGLLVAWRNGDAHGEVRAMIVSQAGTMIAGPRTVASPATAVRNVAVMWGNETGLIAWSDARSGAMGLHVAAVDRRVNTVLSPTRLSIRWPDDGAVSLGWDGGAFAAAWWEPVGGAKPRAYFALIDPQGRRIGSAMRLWTRDTVGLRDVSLAWTSPHYLLATAPDSGGIELRATGPRGCDEPP